MPKSDYFVHPSSFVDEGARIGEGSAIWHFCHVFKGAEIGRKCKIGQNVVVHSTVKIGNNVKIQNNVSLYDGVILEDDVFCGPSCVFTNIKNPRCNVPRNSPEFYKPIIVRQGASIGANATIVCGVTIGRFAFIGAGAVVTKNVGDYELVYGNPAERQGWMSEHGERLVFRGNKAVCPASGQIYRKTGRQVKRES